MKKIVLTCIALILFANNLTATKLSLGLGIDMGIGIAAQIDNKINLHIGHAGFALDYLFLSNNKINIDGDFPGDLSWYLGGGGAYYFSNWNGKNKDIDVRLPLGVDWNFHKKCDSYLQIIPSLRISDNLGFGFGGAIGVRYHF